MLRKLVTNENIQPFFFITSYESVSSSILAAILNNHPDIYCDISQNDPFLFTGNNYSGRLIDKYIEVNRKTGKTFSGNVQRFSAYELHYKILTEKSESPIFQANVLLSPKLRIEFILKSWTERFNSEGAALAHIETKLKTLKKEHHNLFELYIFHYFYSHLSATADREKIDTANPKKKLFILALAKLLTYDSADFPVPTKTFRLEQLIQSTDNFIELIHFITGNKIQLNDQFKSTLSLKLKDLSSLINKMQGNIWEDWQVNILNRYLQLNLHTIYYPHIVKPLADYYVQFGYPIVTYKDNKKFTYSKLISIQLNSNRPTQLFKLFDNIEETADCPQEVEVLVNIDDNHESMEKILSQEIPRRKFSLKFIATPKPKSFCDLWKPINKLLAINDPDCYFLLNISDEMLFASKGWDTTLKKYVGFFPDHIFRLRASRNKFKNYFDRWECSFAQDSIPITTKKWIDIGGDWNPCFGPDSFQQLVAFYLAKESEFSSSNFLRDIPIIDIQFQGDVPSLGLSPFQKNQHHREHIKAMEICQSYKMQVEAKRRALLLKANIISSELQLEKYTIEDVKNKKQIVLTNIPNNMVVAKLSYKLNWLSVTLTNTIRKLNFSYYFGGGKDQQKNIVRSFLGYLKTKYYLLYLIDLIVRKRQKPTFLRTLISRYKKNLLIEENERLQELCKILSLENEQLKNKMILFHPRESGDPSIQRHK